MKTETIRGETVVRVDNDTPTCRAKGSRIKCVFFHKNCYGGFDGPPCKEGPVIFIYPDQLYDHLALKLVS